MPDVQTCARRLAIGVAAATAAACVSTGSASASAGPACGEIVTTTTLRADLRDCPGDGLIVGSDGITLDLNGHTIDGDGASGGDDVGIRSPVAGT